MRFSKKVAAFAAVGRESRDNDRGQIRVSRRRELRLSAVEGPAAVLGFHAEIMLAVAPVVGPLESRGINRGINLSETAPPSRV